MSDSWACRNKAPPPGLLGMTDLFSCSPGGQKPEIRVLVGPCFFWDSGWNSFLLLSRFWWGPLILGDPRLAAAPSSM